MLFNSFHFLIFFPVVFLLYYRLPGRYRPWLLLAASYYFYMCWNPAYILLILLATALNYGAALGISRFREQPGWKKCFLILGMVTSLGILFVYKYLDFAADILGHILGRTPHFFHLLLPVGISFYTFQAMSYTIDVYQGRIRAERNFGYFALFVSFFPQLVAGPIEKSENLLPQLRQVHPFRYENVTEGLKLMAIGFFRKLVVADNLAPVVNAVYRDPRLCSGGTLVFATVLFALQIYCDFCGYSDIARGCAKTLGIDLMVNFREPYSARSPKEFWRRWHISLSSWFRDYVYIPLGGSRRPLFFVCCNLMITFLLSGLWHGANYTFALWGLYHGLLLAAGVLLARLPLHRKESRTRAVLETFATFCLICVGWVFFRADSLEDAFYILSHAFGGSGYFSAAREELTAMFGMVPLLALGAYILILALVDRLNRDGGLIARVSRLSAPWRYPLYVAWIVMILLCMPKNAPAEFIYFQF